jgi:UDPglucose 6-dehydrogenase
MQFLYPGLGFGGSCFPKDLRALVRTGEEVGLKMELASAAVRANEVPVSTLVAHMDKDLGGLKDKVIAIWGIAFKPRTDDVREAPAIKLMEELLERGAKVRATDPQALVTGKQSLEALGIADKVQLLETEYKTCEGADALVVATEWNEYRNPDMPRLKSLMRGRFVFDGRNCLDPDAAADAGLVYRGMGRQQRGA